MCDIPLLLLAAQGQTKGKNKWLTDRDHSHVGHAYTATVLTIYMKKAVLAIAKVPQI